MKNWLLDWAWAEIVERSAGVSMPELVRLRAAAVDAPMTDLMVAVWGRGRGRQLSRPVRTHRQGEPTPVTVSPLPANDSHRSGEGRSEPQVSTASVLSCEKLAVGIHWVPGSVIFFLNHR